MQHTGKNMTNHFGHGSDLSAEVPLFEKVDHQPLETSSAAAMLQFHLHGHSAGVPVKTGQHLELQPA